jgi:hypothetical protein
MTKRHAVYEYDSTNIQLDVYHGSTYTPTTDVLVAMTGSRNLRAPHDWPSCSMPDGSLSAPAGASPELIQSWQEES